MKKTVIALLLAMVLVLSLGACGGEEESAEGDSCRLQGGDRAYIPSV